MHVIAGIPTGALLDPVDRVAGRALLAALLASALAIAAAGLVAELMLVRRLRGLVAASRRIAAGEWSARTGLPRGRDELGELVTSFDEMARSLERLDGEKRAREEQLRQAQKMEAVGRLAGGVAHDFNNVLTVILSAGRALSERLPPGDPGQEDAQEILESGARAAALTRQLLSFSRQQPLAPRTLELGETALRTERMLGRLLGERIAFSVNVRAPGRVRADPGQTELALVNLVVNARDAMAEGGRLEVEVDELGVADPRRPAGDDVPPGPLAVLRVRDDGPGIPAEIRERIFEPFFTTKESGRGTGLGLSTVLGIVQQSGGAIRVDSAPGRGSEFAIYLPLDEGEPEDVAAERRAPPARGSETVLLVEDDERVRAVVRRTLAAHGYRVVEASGAAAARAAARAPSAPPDLLLTDVILADGNGVDVAREATARWPGLPVVFISGYAGVHLPAVESLPRQARFLPKPFAPEALLAEVRAALAARAPAPARPPSALV
jgi:signal transduction histidine kinase/CheY-like chemotaxis protein